jgi:hypothetical protein
MPTPSSNGLLGIGFVAPCGQSTLEGLEAAGLTESVY